MMCKWFGACEATWRLFQFPMRDMRPSVLPLAMHLEGGQRVVFNTANPVAALSDRNRRSTLTAYFETKDRELYKVHRSAEKQMIAARINLNALPVECLGYAYKFVSSVLYVPPVSKVFQMGDHREILAIEKTYFVGSAQ